mmetsp:Transcript_102894/g.178517  ORF Transcript_102894/g.178517 Transcript_102894/m.178517 type:complete len:82 (+) Transcript_102894:462-707(+)
MLGSSLPGEQEAGQVRIGEHSRVDKQGPPSNFSFMPLKTSSLKTWFPKCWASFRDIGPRITKCLLTTVWKYKVAAGKALEH